METKKSSDESTSKNPVIRTIKIRGFVMLLVVSVSAWYIQANALAFKPDPLTSLPSLFGYLILISLFVERVIEVILSSWRSGGADKLDRQINKLSQKIVNLNNREDLDPGEKAKLKEAEETLGKVRDERTEYSSASRFASIWIGVVVGVIVALAGVRILGNLLDTSPLTDDIHKNLLIVVDVSLTGFVLAGGSEAINKIMKIYNSFTTKVAEKNKPDTM
jgi:hypothetical protein